MVVFRQTRGPEGGAVSGGRGPVIPSLLQNKEAGRAKIITSLIKIIISLDKIREEIKSLREIFFFFYLKFLNSK